MSGDEGEVGVVRYEYEVWYRNCLGGNTRVTKVHRSLTLAKIHTRWVRGWVEGRGVPR